MTMRIFYGTESGNSEMVASDIADEYGLEAEDMTELDADVFEADTLYLIVCATHGEGELPEGVDEFVEALRDARPDLTGVRYAMFGLGDSTYPDYSEGSEIIDVLLTELGAKRVGEYGRHDAAGGSDCSELGLTWAEAVVEQHALVPVG